MRTLFSTLFVFLCLAGPTLAEVPTTPLAQDFDGIGYRIDSGGEVQVFAAPRQVGDKLAVCGIVVFAGATATTRAIERRFSERIAFKIAGQPLHVTTDLFKRYKSPAEAQAANTAGCSVSNLPWDKSYAKTRLDMKLAATTITF